MNENELINDDERENNDDRQWRGGGVTRVSEWIRMPPPPPVMGLQSLPSSGIGLGFHSK